MRNVLSVMSTRQKHDKNMRSVLASLPYELPKSLYVELFLAVVFGFNDMPTANFPSASPRMILEGKRYDIADRCQVPFGTIITADFAGKEQDSYLRRSFRTIERSYRKRHPLLCMDT
jgi:hypothetical protein